MKLESQSAAAVDDRQVASKLRPIVFPAWMRRKLSSSITIIYIYQTIHHVCHRPNGGHTPVILRYCVSDFVIFRSVYFLRNFFAPCRPPAAAPLLFSAASTPPTCGRRQHHVHRSQKGQNIVLLQPNLAMAARLKLPGLGRLYNNLHITLAQLSTHNTIPHT